MDGNKLVKQVQAKQQGTQQKQQNVVKYNCQKHIFTFILDVKLFTVSTGIAPNDGKL